MKQGHYPKELVVWRGSVSTSLIIWIIVGAIVGVVVDAVLGGVKIGLAGAMVIGIIGGIISGWLLQKFGIYLLAYPWGTALNALFGALLLVLIVGIIRRV
jgi:uncharacterized membrane protein YeaQ/YmgE (transglycosylase-associated protein family)